jgi:predicted O-methyltransferase YrrM
MSLDILKQASRTKHSGRLKNSQYKPHTNSYIPKEFIRMEPWEIEYLYMLGKQAKVGILETGRFRGGSTTVFAHANRDVPIYSIDLEPQDDVALARLMQDNNFGSNVQMIVGDSQHSKYDQIKQYDLMFIDGDHSYAGCLADLNNWWNELAPGGHVVCHDCYFGNEVQDAVVEFLKNKQVNIYLTPYIQAEHWHLPYGSLCHFQKPY